MREKTFHRIITLLNGGAPNVYVFVLQAGNDGGTALTAGQIETARNAAKSVLEITGAEVAANASVIALDPIGENETGRLLVDITQETKENEQ